MITNAYAAAALGAVGCIPKKRATIGISVTQNSALLLSQMVARSALGSVKIK